MNILELGAIGELVGGAAVMVTLIYLAVQMRQSNEVARADAAHKVVNTWSVYRQMITDAGLSEVMAKARAEEELSPSEKIRLWGMIAEMTYASLAAYMNQRSYRLANFAPAAVAAEIGDSAVLRETWAILEDALRRDDLAPFADEVSRRLNVGRDHPDHWSRGAQGKIGEGA